MLSLRDPVETAGQTDLGCSLVRAEHLQAPAWEPVSRELGPRAHSRGLFSWLLPCPLKLAGSERLGVQTPVHASELLWARPAREPDSG